MLGPFNEKQLEEIFTKFENEVRSRTLADKSDTNKKEDLGLSVYSEKAVKLHALLNETSTFGCQTENVKKLVELLIDEELPPLVGKKEKKKTNAIDKYDRSMCVVRLSGKEYLYIINVGDYSVDFLFDGSNIGFDEIIRPASSQELDTFFSFVKQLINVKGGFDSFFNWLYEDKELEDYWELFFTGQQWTAIDD